MNIPTREELQTLRVVVGNNTPTTHPILGTIPVKGTFPLPLTQTGTITTNNAGGAPALAGRIVAGVGTLFITGGVTYKVEVGDYLAHPTTREIRRIEFVNSDTMLTLVNAFSASVTGVALLLVKKNYYRYILASSTGTAAASLNEQGFAINDKFFNDGAPLSYDVSTASSEISFTLSF